MIVIWSRNNPAVVFVYYMLVIDKNHRANALSPEQWLRIDWSFHSLEKHDGKPTKLLAVNEQVTHVLGKCSTVVNIQVILVNLYNILKWTDRFWQNCLNFLFILECNVIKKYTNKNIISQISLNALDSGKSCSWSEMSFYPKLHWNIKYKILKAVPIFFLKTAFNATMPGRSQLIRR